MQEQNVEIKAHFTEPAHEHKPGKEWKSDGKSHWHICSECDDKLESAAHTPGDWIIDTPATATEDGAKHKECTVCHRELESATIPATGSEHSHAYGDWKSDAENHWKQCDCGEKSETAAHTFVWKTDRNASKTETGLKHEECSVCGFKRGEGTVIPKIGGKTAPILLIVAGVVLAGAAAAAVIIIIKSKKKKEETR